MFRKDEYGSEEYLKEVIHTMGNGKNFEYNADLSANYSKHGFR